MNKYKFKNHKSLKRHECKKAKKNKYQYNNKKE